MISDKNQGDIVRTAAVIACRNDLEEKLTDKGFVGEYLSSFILRCDARPLLAHRAYREVIRFLIIVSSRPHIALTPSKVVGTMWLDMNRVESFSFYNNILHELDLPYLLADEGRAETHQKQYARVLEVYLSLFGEPPTDLWPTNGGARLETFLAHDFEPD